MKTVIFLHGWGCNKDVWKEQIKYFSERYDCRAWDFSGFGEKPLTKEMTVFDYARETVEQIKAVTNEKVVIVGHSFGGRVAIILNALYPHLIEKTALVSSAGLIDRSLKKKIKTYIYKGKKLFVKWGVLNERVLSGQGSKDYLETSGLKRKTFLNIINTDLAEYAKLSRTPTLLVWGENDAETPLKQGRRLARLTKGGLAVMKGCGHFCFLEKPTQFNKILESFLQN